MPSLLAFYAFALGAIVGSFLNVVIYRYPRQESIVFPGSHCPSCHAAIRWFDNIPIVSFLILSVSLVDALLGALFGAVILVAIIGAYWLVRRAEGMGQGDIKMLAMIGAVLGWRSIPAVLLLASISGAVIGVPLALRSGRGM